MRKTPPAKTTSPIHQKTPVPFRPFPYIEAALEREMERRPGVSRNYVLNEKLAIAFKLPAPNLDEIDRRKAGRVGTPSAA